MRNHRLLLIIAAALVLGAAVSSPYLPGAAWPGMRGGLSGSGVGPLAGAVTAGAGTGTAGTGTSGPGVVRFHTGSGIFSTPVIDDHDRVYVGSADHFFSALDPATGQELWKYETGEIIDSAAAGTFRMKALTEKELALPAGVTLKSFTYDLKKGVIVGSAEVSPRSGRPVILGIMVTQGEGYGPPNINLNLALTRSTVSNLQTVTFTAPQGFALAPGMRAYLIADLHPLATLELK